VNRSRQGNLDYGREIFSSAGYTYWLLELCSSSREKGYAGGARVHPWVTLKRGIALSPGNRLVWNAMLQLTILYSVFAALTVLTIDLAARLVKSHQFGFILWLLLGGDGIRCRDFGALGRRFSWPFT